MIRYAIASNAREVEKLKTFYRSIDEALANSNGKKVFEIQLHPEVYDMAMNLLHMIVTEKSYLKGKEGIFADYNKARDAYNKLGVTIHDVDIRTIWRINEVKMERVYSIK